jgi:hypothetical protein
VHAWWHFNGDGLGQQYGRELDFPGVYAMLQAAQNQADPQAAMNNTMASSVTASHKNRKSLAFIRLLLFESGPSRADSPLSSPYFTTGRFSIDGLIR